MSAEYNVPNRWEDSLERARVARAIPKGSRVHVSGVCGTGTSAVAVLLKEKGFRVSGSDTAFYPPMGDIVRSICSPLYEDFSATNITDDLSLVVIGNALRSSNPEVVAAIEKGVPFCSMPEAFLSFLIGDHSECATSVVVAGTHGKTTTTALTAWLLEAAGRKPGYFLGGAPGNFPTHSRSISNEVPLADRVVVLEGDEYDSAFFAKWPKFHSYRADILVITSLEFDHADIYTSVDAIREEFEKAICRMPSSGIVLYWDGAREVETIRQHVATLPNAPKFISYGLQEEATFQLVSRKVTAGAQELSIRSPHAVATYSVPLFGEHNALNAVAAVAVGELLGLPQVEIAKGLRSFLGVQRRQQLLFNGKGVVVLEDFAHHPTAVDTTLRGIREQYPNSRLVAVFEPRSNTSRRHFFQESYGKSFIHADVILIQEVADASGYSAFGDTQVALNVQAIIAELQKVGKIAISTANTDLMYQRIIETIKPGDVVVLMSNGAFGGIPKKLKTWATEEFNSPSV